MSFETLNFTQLLIITLIALLFFKDELKRIVFDKFGVKVQDRTEGKMDTLIGHFNHETTGLLESILAELKWVRKDQMEQSKMINLVISRVEEMIKYGVPERK